ncbi:TPA: protein-tyrosine-phosphatase, variant 2 [Trebouxia sp. C0004]
MPKRAREEPCAICGHWHDYEAGEPCTVCGHTLARTDDSANRNSAFPTEILPGFLYLGSYDNASRSELLKTVGITHILNTVPTCQNLYKNSFHYHTVSSKPPEYNECFSYLDSVQQEKGRVLVHCMTGTSMSPSVVIGYLMRLRRWRLNESYKWVHDRRACVSLQEGEATRLQQLEVQVLGESSTGFKNNGAAQQSPGVIAVSHHPCACSGTSLQCCETLQLSAAYSLMLPYSLAILSWCGFCSCSHRRHAPIT